MRRLLPLLLLPALAALGGCAVYPAPGPITPAASVYVAPPPAGLRPSVLRPYRGYGYGYGVRLPPAVAGAGGSQHAGPARRPAGLATAPPHAGVTVPGCDRQAENRYGAVSVQQRRFPPCVSCPPSAPPCGARPDGLHLCRASTGAAGAGAGRGSSLPRSRRRRRRRRPSRCARATEAGSVSHWSDGAGPGRLARISAGRTRPGRGRSAGPRTGRRCPRRTRPAAPPVPG